MPSLRHHDFGNLYIQFNVKFPEKGWTQDADAFESLRAILPAPTGAPTPPAEAMTEPGDLEDVDMKRSGFAGAMDEDEEDGHPQGERVAQCATQ
jgi:DnaJ family protein A protein 2